MPTCPSNPPEPERPSSEGILYQRARFSTRLPADCRYTAAHFWLREIAPGLWRVGLTRFATRLLGEIVEYDFEVAPNTPVRLGQILGWLEAFKAITDLYAVAAGAFLGGNPALANNPEAITTDPYATGWLYEIQGTPDPAALDVQHYIAHLDQTIDQLQGARREKP